MGAPKKRQRRWDPGVAGRAACGPGSWRCLPGKADRGPVQAAPFDFLVASSLWPQLRAGQF